MSILPTSQTLISRSFDLNDSQAWEERVGHYRHFIYHVLHQLNVSPSDIDDIFQQILIHLAKSLSTYDSSKGRFRSWLSTVIRNTAYMHFRKQKTKQSHMNVFMELVEREDKHKVSEVDDFIEKEWTNYVMQQAMAQIQPAFKGQAIEVFELNLKGMPAAEIAKNTGLTISSVYTLTKRVKRRLYMEVRAIVADLEPVETVEE